MTYTDDKQAPPVIKQSRAKIWIKTGIFVVFGTLFGLTLYRDIMGGIFHLSWALIAFLPCIGIGYGLSKLVPMKFWTELRVVTMSFDRIYFALILLLVTIKTVSGQLIGMSIIADVIMCMILGIMSGRIGGIGLRVHALRNGAYAFFSEQASPIGQFSK